MGIDSTTVGGGKPAAPVSIRAIEAAAAKKDAPATKPAQTATKVAKPVEPTKPSLSDAARDNAKAASHASKPSKAPEPTKASPSHAARDTAKAASHASRPSMAPKVGGGGPKTGPVDNGGAKGPDLKTKGGPTQTPPKGEAPKPETRAADRVENYENSSRSNRGQAARTAREQQQASEALDDTRDNVEEKKEELGGKKSDVFWNAMNPINGVLSLLGVDNGLTEAQKAAQEVSEQVRDSEEKAETLQQEVQDRNREALRLSRNQDRIDSSLETAVDHNALVNTVAAVGDAEAARRLDEINPLDSSIIKVAESKIKGATASYNFDNDTIIITAGMADRTRAAREAAQGAGTLDASGNPLKPTALVDSTEGRALLGNAAVTSHEAAHAIQDANGEIDATNTRVDAILQDARAVTRGMPPEDAQSIIASAEVKAAKVVLEETEYGPNLEQEQLEAKGGKNSFPVMLDAAGSPLPKDQALANLWAVYTNNPLLHGPSAGLTMPGSGAAMSDNEFANSLLAADEVEGRGRPGRGRP